MTANPHSVHPGFAALAAEVRMVTGLLNDQLRDGDIEPGSTASGDLEAEHAFADDLLDAPVRQVLMTGHRALIAAGDHLLGIAACIAAEDVILATLTLMRPTAIAAGTSFFLLDAEVPLLERVRRAWNLELESLREQANTFAAGSEPRAIATGNREQVLEWGRRHGFEVVTSRQQFGESRYWFVTEHSRGRPPSELKLAEDVLEHLGETEAGRNLYRFTSAFLHVQGHAFTLLVPAEGVVDPQTPGAVPQGVTLHDLTTWLAITAAAVDFAMQRCGRYFGWSMEPWMTVARPILRRWALQGE